MLVISQKRFIQEALDAHNDYRQKHGAPPLELDANLTQMALGWAEHLAELNSTLKYSFKMFKTQQIGENILRCSLDETSVRYFSGQEATDEWYKQEANYAYDGQFSPNTGNFTQVVWKKSTKVGFAFALTDNGKFYAVANYWPAGNIKGLFKENVLPAYSTTATTTTIASPTNSSSTKSSPSPKQKHQSVPYPITRNDDRMPNSITSSKRIDPFQTNSTPTTSSFSSTGHGQSDDDMQAKFIREALDCHNKCRRKHGVPPLSHNPELSKIALNYAKYLASKKTMVHSKNKFNNNEPLGENLAYSYDSRVDYYPGEKATLQWYDGIHNHDFEKDYQPRTGHFTQVIWKSTKEVGFGVAKASDGSFYAVGNYLPAGNFIGRYVLNVPRPF